jgi:hypothetical protein
MKAEICFTIQIHPGAIFFFKPTTSANNFSMMDTKIISNFVSEKRTDVSCNA